MQLSTILLMDCNYTSRQGQCLAFIYYYTKLHREPPAEQDIAHYFKITAPAAHRMVIALAERDFITRTPGQARSIRLLLPREKLPDLE